MKRFLEVCCASVASAIAARDGGAFRVELCSALEIGGITPSAGLMEQVRHIDGIKMNVLIRPRGGDFLFDRHEVACMEHDIIAARQCRADGVVIGALTANGDIDIDTCRRLIDAADGMSITFHRAFDRCRKPLKALEDIIALGCDRLLTSGQASTASNGIDLLKQLTAIADGRIIIMPGCGVNATNATHILNETGAIEIHASCRHRVNSNMTYRNSGVSMGNSEYDEYSRTETDQAEVNSIVRAISDL